MTKEQGYYKKDYNAATSLYLPVEHAAIKKPAIQDERKDDPATMQRDTAVYESYSTFLQGGFDRMVNPDKLVRNKGAKIYNKMLLDDQVSAAFNLKLNIIISRKMRFEPTGPNQEKIIDFFQRNVNDLISGTWLQALRTILMGKAYGFSISEKVFRQATVDGSPRWVIDRINPKPYDSFIFDVDKWGNLKAIRQDVEGRAYGFGGKKLNIDKFIIYVNKPEIDPIWGQSDLKPAYTSYWNKDITSKYWSIYLERSAGGFISVTPQKDAGNLREDQRRDLENAVKNITGKTGILLPKGYEAQLQIHDETEAFKHRMEHADKQISRSILIPNLLGFSEQGKVGSYSQSQTQLDVFMMLIREDGDYLADILNEQLFSQLAWWNFGVREYPKAVFDEFTAEQKRLMAEIWINAHKEGAVTNMVADEIHTRTLLNYPVPEEEELQQSRNPGQTPTDEDVTDDQGSIEENGKDDSKAATNTQNEESKVESGHNIRPVNINISNSPTAGTIPNDKTSSVQACIDHGIDHQEDDGGKITFSDRIDFQETASSLDDIEDNFVEGLEKGVDTAFKELEQTITVENKKVPKDKSKMDWDGLEKSLNNAISAKTKSGLNKSIQSSLRNTYNLGWNTSHRATKKAALDAEAPDKFIKKINTVALLSERRMCVEDQWSFVNFVEGLSLEAADGWFKSQAFKITGDLTQDMIDDAITIMRTGIVEEWSTRQIINELKDVLTPILEELTPKAGRARLETIVRTNMSTIFTQAQLAFYNDPALNGFVEALEYSAVIDRRTTPICERLNGSIYRINNTIWRFITPPNHFNCRSVMIPVTVLDMWKQDKGGFTEKEVPGKGFGRTGFANLMKIALKK